MSDSFETRSIEKRLGAHLSEWAESIEVEDDPAFPVPNRRRFTPWATQILMPVAATITAVVLVAVIVFQASNLSVVTEPPPAPTPIEVAPETTTGPDGPETTTTTPEPATKGPEPTTTTPDPNTTVPATTEPDTTNPRNSTPAAEGLREVETYQGPLPDIRTLITNEEYLEFPEWEIAVATGERTGQNPGAGIAFACTTGGDPFVIDTEDFRLVLGTVDTLDRPSIRLAVESYQNDTGCIPVPLPPPDTCMGLPSDPAAAPRTSDRRPS